MNREAIRRHYPKIKIGLQLNLCTEYRTIYVTNQKAGCSSIKLMLYRAQTGDLSLDPKNVHRADPLPRPRDLGWQKVERLLGDEGFVFTFVRHPVSRALSAYRNKIFRKKTRISDKIRSTLNLSPEHEITLDEFFAALEATDPHDMDPHWAPQHINTMQQAITYDFVGRLENFAADMERVRQAAGLPRIPMVHRNNRKAVADISATADQRRRLERIYARDFEIFGY